MDRNGTVAVFLLILIVADVSNASLFSNFQRFLGVASSGGSGINQVSPSPIPDPLQAGANKTSSNDDKVPSKPDKVDSGTNSSNFNLTADPSPINKGDKDKNGDSNTKSSNVNITADPPPPNKGDEDKHGGKTNENDTKKDSQSEVGLNCTGFPRRCSDGNYLVACVLKFENEHQTFVVLAQNDGDSNLKVDLSASNPDNSTSLEIPKHQTKMTNLTFGNSNEVILKTVDGDCVLHRDIPVSQGNFFVRLPSYDPLITPINGAYLIITVLVFGGMSICCLFRRKRRQDGIPYQELEMGLPDSSTAINVEPAEGWDKGWDDDWDDDNAVKTRVGSHVASISANGLSSRSPKKEDWENDWDS